MSPRVSMVAVSLYVEVSTAMQCSCWACTALATAAKPQGMSARRDEIHTARQCVMAATLSQGRRGEGSVRSLSPLHQRQSVG
jgi:hypothetical protein